MGVRPWYAAAYHKVDGSTLHVNFGGHTQILHAPSALTVDWVESRLGCDTNTIQSALHIAVDCFN